MTKVNEHCSKSQLSKLLGVSAYRINKVLSEYNIKELSKIDIGQKIHIIHMDDCNFLINKQQEIYEKLCQNYYLYDEIIEMGITTNCSFYKKLMKEAVTIPLLARIGKLQLKTVVYPKNIADNFVSYKDKITANPMYSKIDVAKILEIECRYLNDIYDEFGIEVYKYRGEVRIKQNDLDFLLHKQNELYENLNKNYYTFKEVKLMGLSGLHEAKNALVTLNIPGLVRTKKFKKKSTNNLYIKLEIDKIIAKNPKNGISLHKISKQLDINMHSLKLIIKEYNLEILSVHKKTKYINITQYETLLNKQNQLYNYFEANYYSINELEDFGFTLNYIKRKLTKTPIPLLIKIKKFKYTTYAFLKTEIDLLLYQKNKMLKFIENKQLKSKVKQSKPIISIEPPTENEHFTPNIMHLKPQISIESPTENKKFKPKVKQSKPNIFIESRTKTIRKIFSVIGDPYESYEKLIQHYNITSLDKTPITYKYWNLYVKEVLLTSKGNDITITMRINRLISVTEFLIKTINEKELFSFSSNELNLLFFNKNVFLNYRNEIFAFLNKVNSYLPNSLIRLQNINNPYEEERNKIRKKETYTSSEYIDLLNYVIDIDLHKKNAIEDIIAATNNLNNKKVKNYDSAWLYVLLHMNNGWRKNDIINFPRLKLNNINLKSIKWFANYNLSFSEAKNIINQIKSQIFIHSKNNKRRYFFCSDELMIPLATAIILCELRVQILNPRAKTLINFDIESNNMSYKSHHAFFKNFKKGFMFKSLKMNRTFLSLMSDVIKQKTNRNPVEILKIIRNHSSIDVTDIYINIPKEHLDFITKQIFDVGYFGYTYDIMSLIILEKIPQFREERTKSALLIKEIFGDIYKIESLSRYINVLEKEQKNLSNYLLNLNIKELTEKFDFLTFGLLPSKEQYYQCIYGKCIFEERDCNKCTLSIPHFYARCLSI